MIPAKGQLPRNLTTNKNFVIIKSLKEKTKGETSHDREKQKETEGKGKQSTGVI